MKQFAVILILLITGTAIAGVIFYGENYIPPGNVYVISIGINNYSKANLVNAVNDSKALVEKIKRDCPRRSWKEILKQDSLIREGQNVEKWFEIDTVYSILLNDENASLTEIRNAFQMVIQSAKPNDYFIFYFGGYTKQTGDGKTLIIPFINHDLGHEFSNINEHETLSLSELAKLMEQIQCINQLIISEAGNGKTFAQNLISEMFESNPLVATGTERNRIIITTRGIGYDTFRSAHVDHAPLMYYILNSENILNAFYDIDSYELDLCKSEINESVDNKKYFSVYQEKQYREFILNNYQKSNTRGAAVLQSAEETPDAGSEKTYALVVASNHYGEKDIWKDLKNPLNDAEVFAGILQKKYNVEVHKVYDQPKDSVLVKLIEIKKLMGENDKFIFFIAGHGYYSRDYSDGFIVFPDSRNIREDMSLESYLQMASLQRILDNVQARNLFAIFDICFGATFDLGAKDLALSDYEEVDSDISLDEFITRKDTLCSRIFLASGRYEVPDFWKDTQSHSPFADKLIKIFEQETEFISPGKVYSKMEGNITQPFLKYFGKHDTRGDFLIKAMN